MTKWPRPSVACKVLLNRKPGTKSVSLDSLSVMIDVEPLGLHHYLSAHASYVTYSTKIMCQF